MRRILLALGALGLGLAAVLGWRAFTLESHQPEVTPPEPVALDAPALAERLAASLRIRTVSHMGGRDRDDAAFRRFHAFLEEGFPRVHRALRRERVSGLSLLYTWPGSEPGLAPLLLLGHSDVVPVEEPGAWTQPPYAGRVADGYVWGRGAIDDKLNVTGQLEAVARLLEEGFEPRRTVLLAFGHDEEIGGPEGAAAISALLEERGVRPELVLDEGGSVVRGVVPGVAGPVAVVGIAEKGYVSAELVAEVPGDHSSTPPAETSIGVLSREVARLEASPLPARIEGPARALFERGIGPEAGLGYRLLFANLWLFGPLLEPILADVPRAGALLRTTTAPTILEAGFKDNVIPGRARAVVNFRILPGDSIESTLAHVRDVVQDPRVEIRALEKRRNPSPASRIDSAAWDALARTVREIFPETVVAPYLVLGGTDARHYRPLSEKVYRFQPLVLTGEDLGRIHGRNERVSVEGYADAVRFYRRLILNTAGAPPLRRGRP